MTTRLDSPLKREIVIDGAAYTVTIDPRGLKLVLKGKRKGYELDAGKLGPSLKWEASRGGALFPHLYDALPLVVVTRTVALARSAHGSHDLPPEFP